MQDLITQSTFNGSSSSSSRRWRSSRIRCCCWTSGRSSWTRCGYCSSTGTRMQIGGSKRRRRKPIHIFVFPSVSGFYNNSIVMLATRYCSLICWLVVLTAVLNVTLLSVLVPEPIAFKVLKGNVAFMLCCVGHVVLLWTFDDDEQRVYFLLRVFWLASSSKFSFYCTR